MNGDLKPYVPFCSYASVRSVEEYSKREDFDIWNLVGCEPILSNLINVYRQFSEWCRVTNDYKARDTLEGVIVAFELSTYDRFAARRPKPSEEYVPSPILEISL